jgi:GT2 family glycosyltransferase
MKKYEQEFVAGYAEYLVNRDAEIFHMNCSSKANFDLQFKLNGITWCFEAKSHMSGDAYNGVHKLFGELMKDATRILENGNTKWKLGLLLDARESGYVKLNGFDFYSKKIAEIDKSILKEFGKNIRIKKVVFFDPEAKAVLWEGTWNQFFSKPKNLDL